MNKPSYSKDLWLGFDLIQKHFNKDRNKIKTILYILSEKKNIEYEYANELDKLIQMYEKVRFEEPEKEESSLKNAIQIFFDEMQKEYDYHMENVKLIEEKILKELSNLLQDQLETANELHDSIITYPKNFIEITKVLEDYQTRFHSSVVIVEGKILEIEKKKEEYEQKNKKPFQKNDKDEKDLVKKLNLAKGNEKQYREFLSQANEERVKFLDKTSEILDSFQKMDSQLSEFLKDKFINFIEFNHALCDNLNNSYNLLKNTFMEVNCQNDMDNFITKNAIVSFPPTEFKFVPYSSEKTKRVTRGETPIKNEILQKTLQIINQNFNNKPNEEDAQILQDYEVIEKIILDIWDEKKNADLSKMNFLFEVNEKYREHFLNCVNRYRNCGLYLIKEKTYDMLGQLMNQILVNSFNNNDYKNIKFCLILSETLYLGDNNKNVLLKNAIINNEILQKENFWNNLIDYSINDAIAQQKDYLYYINEKMEDKQQRMKNTILGVLITYWDNMMAFSFPIEQAKHIIKELAKKNDIEEEYIFKEKFDQENFEQNLLAKNQV